MHLFLLLILWIYQGTGEELHIIQTKGEIIVKKTGRVLKKGDKIKAEEMVEFRPADAKALVVSTQRGTLILQKPQHAPRKNNELLYMVKSSLISSSGTLGTRSGPVNTLTDLKTFLTDNRLLVLDTARIPLNTQSIPLSEDQYFFIRYSYNKQAINKKLDHRNSTFFIDRNMLTVDGQKVPADSCQNFTLYYRNDKKNESIPVTRFSPVFPDMVQVKEEVRLLQGVLQKAGKAEEQIRKEVQQYIYEAYGKPTEADFKAWLTTVL